MRSDVFYPNPEHPEVTLTTYILEDSPRYDTGKKRPGILILPGGGYTFVSDREGQFIALSYAAEGYHTFVLRYSTGVMARVPGPLLDGFCALAFIREHAEEWNLDPEKVLVCGFSAGGHLASGLMTLWKNPEILRRMNKEPEVLRPYAGILCYALLRLPYPLRATNTGVPVEQKEILYQKIEEGFFTPQHPEWKNIIFEKDGILWMDAAAMAYLNTFGSTHPEEGEMELYHAVKQVDQDTPPAFLWSTVPDETVPVQDSIAFAQALIEKGGNAELHIFGSGAHGLSLAKKVTGSKDDSHPAGQWFPLSLRWLESLEEIQPSPFTEEKKESEESDERPIKYYDNIYADREGMFRHTSFSLEQELVDFVKQGNEQMALATLGKINKQGSKATLAKDSLRSAKNSIICSCTFLTRAVIQAGVGSEEAFAISDVSIRHIETLSTEKEVLAYESTMLLQFIRMVKKMNTKMYSFPVRRAIHFIESNLDKPVSLAETAKYVKVHPSYLSKRFNQETGCGISEYANQRRIREASYFVRHTDYSMAEIASLYGFSGQSYFITTFKKVLGVTPGEYRVKTEHTS